MKFFRKILTVAMIAGLGASATWAAKTKEIKAVQSAYDQYRTEYETDSGSDETQEAYSQLESVCNDKCTRFSCTDAELGEVCAKHCPYNAIKNCVKAWDSTLTTKTKVNTYLKGEDLKMDQNTVAEPAVATKTRYTKPKTMREKMSEGFDSFKNKAKNVFSGKANGDECHCVISGNTAQQTEQVGQPLNVQMGQPVQSMQQPVQQSQPVQQQMQQPRPVAPAPAAPSCTPAMMANGDC